MVPEEDAELFRVWSSFFRIVNVLSVTSTSRMLNTVRVRGMRDTKLKTNVTARNVC